MQCSLVSGVSELVYKALRAIDQSQQRLHNTQISVRVRQTRREVEAAPASPGEGQARITQAEEPHSGEKDPGSQLSTVSSQSNLSNLFRSPVRLATDLRGLL